MPAGKEIGSYKATFNSVRVCEINGEEQLVEASYSSKVVGQLSGTGVATMKFSGNGQRGTLADVGIGYLASGDVVTYKGQGVYWASKQGNWETRAAVMVGDQMCVAEGQISMSDGLFSSSGKIFELT